MKKILITVAILFFISCEKKMSISDFQDHWQDYIPELRIEAMVYPTEENIIVRIDRSMNISEEAPFTNHDYNDDGDLDIDINYFHIKDCDVRVYHPGQTDTLQLTYYNDADQFYLYGTPDSINPAISYGAYIPDTLQSIPAGFFSYGSEYQMDCDCPGFSELGTISAKEAVYSPMPPAFLEWIDIESCIEKNPDPLQCIEVVVESDTLNFYVEYNSDSTSYFNFVVPYGSLNYWVSRYKYIGDDNPAEAQYQFKFPGYMYEYGHEVYPLDDIIISGLNFSKEKIYVVEDEEFVYKYLLQAFSFEYAAYIQFSSNGLPLYDPIVSNLRDEGGNVVMGVFAVSSNSTVNAKILFIE
jgi:hypothetical protein